MTRVPTVVIGATFAGVGIAAAAKQKALIVEQASQPGHEFISSYRPGEHWDCKPRTPEGKRFLDQLVQRNVLSDNGLVHIPAVLPVLCHYIKTERLPILLMTTIADISEQPDGYEVTLFHASGMETITAERIIDTSSQGLFHSGKPQSITGKSINAMLHRPAEPTASPPVSYDKSVSFVQGRFESEVILKVELAPDDDWIAARRKLHSLWSSRPESLRSWSIAALADTFEMHTAEGPTEISRNWCRLPSCAYSNLLEAFEAGLRFAESKGANDETFAVGQ